MQQAIQEKNERRLKRAATQLAETLRHAEVVQFSLLCDQRLDRCDAFVAITAVEPNDEDHVGHLADMYSGWARSKGFRVVIAHEELHSRKVTREMVLLIEGIAVYGLLRHEQGLHEFVSGKPASASRKTAFVKVHVLPIVEHEDLEGEQAKVTTKRLRGTALRSERFRTEAKAVDHKSGRQICIRNRLGRPLESKTIAHDLLYAEYRRQTTPVPIRTVQKSVAIRSAPARTPRICAPKLRCSI